MLDAGTREAVGDGHGRPAQAGDRDRALGVITWPLEDDLAAERALTANSCAPGARDS